VCALEQHLKEARLFNVELKRVQECFFFFFFPFFSALITLVVPCSRFGCVDRVVLFAMGVLLLRRARRSMTRARKGRATAPAAPRARRATGATVGRGWRCSGAAGSANRASRSVSSRAPPGGERARSEQHARSASVVGGWGVVWCALGRAKSSRAEPRVR